VIRVSMSHPSRQSPLPGPWRLLPFNIGASPLTNAFSKLENHAAAVSLYVTHYNMCRVHEALRTTPAVALGIADRVYWTRHLPRCQ